MRFFSAKKLFSEILLYIYCNITIWYIQTQLTHLVSHRSMVFLPVIIIMQLIVSWERNFFIWAFFGLLTRFVVLRHCAVNSINITREYYCRTTCKKKKIEMHVSKACVIAWLLLYIHLTSLHHLLWWIISLIINSSSYFPIYVFLFYFILFLCMKSLLTNFYMLFRSWLHYDYFFSSHYLSHNNPQKISYNVGQSATCHKHEASKNWKYVW